jgi:predicted adenine nucleotide alpha hydrolase (AANH) superfamily ATPase
MKVLLHVCCGPCTIYPLTVLREEGAEVTGHFYNPNIHPFKEFRRRIVTLEDYAKRTKLPLVLDTNYGLKDFIRKVAFHEEKRCHICYLMRLEKTVSLAREKNYEAFSTTLLYSKYQRHPQLIQQCQQLSTKYDIPFCYRDFREGWQAGVDASKDLDMYRQPYCGCIYSEQERYDKSLRKT